MATTEAIKVNKELAKMKKTFQIVIAKTQNKN